jgi:hypothetical protein
LWRARRIPALNAPYIDTPSPHDKLYPRRWDGFLPLPTALSGPIFTMKRVAETVRSRTRRGSYDVLAIWLVACLISLSHCTSANAQGNANLLGEARLVLTKDPPPPPAEQRPRVALLLIDCSFSMHEGVLDRAVGAGNPQRWAEVRKGLRQTLEELQKASPGIDVRLRFFADELDCLEPAQAKLFQPSDVDILMNRVPLHPPEKGSTALFEATVNCVRELRRENADRKFEWWIFGVFSDGKDGVDETRRKRPSNVKQPARDAELTGMQADGAAEPLVWTVGPDAAKAASQRGYGPARVLQIGDSIPVPPKPPVHFTLALASGQSPGWEIDKPAKSGRYTMAISIDGEVPENLVVVPEIEGQSPFKLLTEKLEFSKGKALSLDVDLPQDVDRSKGAAVNFAFRASNPANSDAVVGGKPKLTITFRADRILPPDEWTLIHEPTEKRGKKTRFVANPGLAKSPRWVFTGPNGAVEHEDGLDVSRAFSVAGRWQCEFTCFSESGVKQDPKDAGSIEIIDSAFTIDPPKASVALGEGAAFTIKRAAGATSPATYTCRVDDKLVTIEADGRTVKVAPENLDQVGRHTLSIVAKSQIGDFEWRNEAAIFVKATPRIGIIPTDFVEGRTAIPVTIQVAGDVGDAVIVSANGAVIDEYPVVYPSGDVQIAQIDAKIPTVEIKRPQVEVEVRPKNEKACPEARAILRGRAADIRAAMKSPVSGSPVTSKGGRELTIEPTGDHVSDVGDVEFLIAFTAPGEKPTGEGLKASKADQWTVAIPAISRLGPADVFAKPTLGRLRQDIFPEGKDWTRIGSLEIKPDPEWIKFILSAALIGLVTWLLWEFVRKNDGRTWTIETSFTDPKSPTNPMDGASIGLRKSRKRASNLPASTTSFTPYAGWSWLPAFSGGKNAVVPLWLFADRNADNPRAQWLTQAAALNPNHPVKITSENPEDPFLQLPDSTIGWCDAMSPYDPVQQGSSVGYSRTWKLTVPSSRESEGGSMWVRVKRRPLKQPNELLAFGIFVALAFAAVLYLLKHFHCVSL